MKQNIDIYDICFENGNKRWNLVPAKPGTTSLLRHDCLLSTQSICQVFGQYLLVNFKFPVTFQIF